MVGRTWAVSGGYRRGIAFVEGFGEPFYSDAATVGVGGLVGRRARVTAAGGFSTGAIGFPPGDGSQFTTYTASADFQYALNRMLAAFAEYVYYHYRFGRDVALPAGQSPDAARSGFRVGLTLWMPLLTRGAADAAR
jgi:hypothetical protein